MNDRLMMYAEGKEANTKRVYLYCGKKLESFMKKRKLTLETIQPLDVRSFVLQAHTKKHKKVSMNTSALLKQYILSILLNIGRKDIVTIARKNLREIKTQHNFRVDLETEEIIRLIKVTKSILLKFGFSIMAFNGLRSSEFLSLHFSDIDVESKQITLKRRLGEKYFPKGMKVNQDPKRLPLDDFCLELFYQLPFKAGERIYPFSYKTLRKHFNKSIKKAKITRTAYPLTLHKLRHFFGHFWTRNKGTIQELKRLLRHSDLRYTLLYSDPSEEELTVSFRKIMRLKQR